MGPSGPPSEHGDLAFEISTLLDDFCHPSGAGFRVPAGDGEKPVLQAFLGRIYPAWTDMTWGALKDKFQVPPTT
eukprot:9040190-Pyramimonas_sp.AAC.1